MIKTFWIVVKGGTEIIRVKAKKWLRRLLPRLVGAFKNTPWSSGSMMFGLTEKTSGPWLGRV